MSLKPANYVQLNDSAFEDGYDGHDSTENLQESRFDQIDEPKLSWLEAITSYLESFSVPEAIQLKYMSAQAFVMVVCGSCMALFGYDQGVFGGVIVGERFVDSFHNPSSGTLGFITSIFDIGCLIGALTIMVLGDHLGRKKSFLYGTLIMAFGSILQSLSWNVTSIAAGRLISGIGNGINTSTAPLYHSEMLEAIHRGKEVAKELVVNLIGFVISNWVTLGFGEWRKTSLQWRLPLFFQLIFVIVIISSLRYIPESPRWLLLKGKKSLAKNICYNSFSEQPCVYEAIFAAVERDEEDIKTSWKDLIVWKKDLRASWRLTLGVALQAMQQLTGINVVAYYLPYILNQSLGLSDFLSRLYAACNSLVFLAASLVSVYIVGNFGRRPVLMTCALLQSICFMILTCSVVIGNLNSKYRLTSAIVSNLAISTFFFVFGSGFLTIPWLYPAEINTAALRTKGAALATASDWFFNFLVVQMTPLGIKYLNAGYYMIYSILNAAFIPLIYFFLIETAGRTLEEIDDKFNESRSANKSNFKQLRSEL